MNARIRTRDAGLHPSWHLELLRLQPTSRSGDTRAGEALRARQRRRVDVRAVSRPVGRLVPREVRMYILLEGPCDVRTSRVGTPFQVVRNEASLEKSWGLTGWVLARVVFCC